MKGSSVQDQLTFIDWELKNTEKKAGDALKGAVTAGDAAKTVSMLYERPANTFAEANQRAYIANNMRSPSEEKEKQSPVIAKPASDYIDANYRAAIASNAPITQDSSKAGNNSTSTVQTHIDTINVITQAKDAVGVANGMRDALAKNQLVNFGMQGAS